MLHLPKNRPWLILILIYALIVGVWVTATILAKKNREGKLGIDETEKLINQTSQDTKSNKPHEPNNEGTPHSQP